MEETIYIVDEKDNFIGKASRKEVRAKALLHRAARVIVFNKEDKFIAQKRSMSKDIYPGYWDIGVAETCIENESYESAAIRGLLEELGIAGISNTQIAHSFLFKTRYAAQEENAFCKVYELMHHGKIIKQDEEIDKVKFLPKEDVKALIKEEKFHPLGRIVFEKYLEMKDLR